MRKVWKKGTALLVCLSLSLSMTAFAEEGQTESTDILTESTAEGGNEEIQTATGGSSEDNNEGTEGTEGSGGTEGTDHLTAPETSEEPGWKEIDGNLYYYGADKKRAEGWLKIGKSWYFFNGNDENYPGILLRDTVSQIEGKYYAFRADGVMLTDWVQREEGWYYANKDGSFAMGWLKSKNKWYYLDPNNAGLMVGNTNMQIDGKWYALNASGAMLTGWIKREEGWYYANRDGSFAMGWLKSKNKWYYLDPNNTGLMVENTNMQVDGKWYALNASGAMLTGWIKREEGWYYANRDGSFAMGWVKSKNKWYYLNPGDTVHPGIMLSNCMAQIGELEYSFLESGAMKAGWENADGNWYYYDTYSGQRVNGWKKISGKWYYFDLDTKQMAPAGWHEIDGVYYYMNGGGDMATGWKKIANKWYYLAGNGSMCTGWKKIGGFWYYFYMENDPNGGTYGAMASNTTIDGYKILSDGKYLSPAQSRMNAMAQGYGSGTGYLIMIDTTNCLFGVFTGGRGCWNMVKYWSCSPGAPATPTVTGVFSVGSKGYYFDSGNLRLYWYTQFYGDYLIHSVCYLHDGSPADLRTGLHLSHGCVRLQIDNAKWVYDNVPGGSTVVAY